MNTLKLKFSRMQKGVTQRQMAKYLDISEKTYSIKETGKSEFDRNEISKIIKALELSTEELYTIFFED